MPSDVRLPNGLRLIVKTEKTSPTVTVIGAVKHNSDLQEPAGKDGADDVLSELFSYGTTTRDRLKYQEELDDIAASESGGHGFQSAGFSNSTSPREWNCWRITNCIQRCRREAFQIVRDQRRN